MRLKIVPQSTPGLLRLVANSCHVTKCAFSVAPSPLSQAPTPALKPKLFFCCAGCGRRVCRQACGDQFDHHGPRDGRSGPPHPPLQRQESSFLFPSAPRPGQFCLSLRLTTVTCSKPRPIHHHKSPHSGLAFSSGRPSLRPPLQILWSPAAATAPGLSARAAQRGPSADACMFGVQQTLC